MHQDVAGARKSQQSFINTK